MPAKPKPRTLAPKPAAPAAPLLADVRELILTAREAVARTSKLSPHCGDNWDGHTSNPSSTSTIR